MPLEWHEVNASLDPTHFTIRNALERMERMGADPVAEVFKPGPSLQTVLSRIAGI